MAQLVRQLTPTDHAAWVSYTRQVRPLRGRGVPDDAGAVCPDAERPGPAPAEPTGPARRRQGSRTHEPIAVGQTPGSLDAGSWNRLRSGKLLPVRTLDLHGRSVQRAFAALNAFLHGAHADGIRCVEVITGKGTGEAGGAIRRELPIWLNLPGLRPLILAASYPHAANSGAVRILLRRVR